MKSLVLKSLDQAEEADSIRSESIALYRKITFGKMPTGKTDKDLVIADFDGVIAFWSR